jgi:hypothetical protein
MSEESLDWRAMECNPLVFQGSRLPPFCVPPEQLPSWTDRDEEDYKFWLTKGSKYTRDDYRQYLISLNKEFNMGDVDYVKLEEGLVAFGKLLSCMKQFPNYNLSKDLDEAYTFEENFIMKEFIKLGVNFVKKRDAGVKKFLSFIKKYDLEAEESALLSQQMDSNKEDEKVCDTVIVQEMIRKTPVAEASNNNPRSLVVEKQTEVEKNPADDCSSESDELSVTAVAMDMSEEIKVVDTPVTKSTSRRKQKRRQRLLKYHQELVNTRGLPPSRIMKQTLGLSSGLEHLRRRNLVDSFVQCEDSKMHEEPFKQQETSVTVVPLPLGTPQAAVHLPGMIGQVNQPLDGVNGTSSNLSNFPMLCSFSPPWASGCCVGPGSGWSTGWPEARPMVGLNCNMPQSSHLYCGGTSTFNNQQSLSPSSQYIMGCQEGMSQPPHTPTGNSPAYCYHCLQYGAVYTINLV